MLAQFRVENFRSFREETELSMVASSCGDHPSHVIEDDTGKSISLLRVGALYGANASGKSNLVKALSFARKLIVDGTKSEQPTGTEPFLIHEDWEAKPSRFEFVIKYGGKLYTYGFVVGAQRVLEEWLFVVSNVREQRWFERVSRRGEKVQVDIGHALARKSSKKRQMLDFVAMGTRPNQLFLTEMHERNVPAVKPLMHWFRNVLTILPAGSRYRLLDLRVHEDSEFTHFLGKLLAEVDTGVSSLRTETLDVDFDKQFPGMPDDVKADIAKVIAGKKLVQIMSPSGNQFIMSGGDGGRPSLLKLRAVHGTSTGQEATFDFEQEADGTQRLAHLAPALFDLKSEEKVYFVDEIDRSMHPILSRALIRTFIAGTNRNARNQLFFTTHETALLDQDLLRRDEIWFVEKDRDQGSHLTSLWDFKVRQDASLRKWYLQGRFGAIPFIGDVTQLGLQSSEED